MTENGTGIQWVRTPHQDRSRKTLERLLDAAEALLQERGFDSVSVAEIAQAAGSSVGAFYARFRDKNGLLNHLHDRFAEEALATTEMALAPERWEGASAYKIIAAVTGFMMELHRTRSGLFRAFLMYGCTEPQFLERERRIMERVIERLTTLLLERRAEIAHPEPALAVALGFELVGGVLRDRFVLRPGEPGRSVGVSDKLRAELTRAYASYLGVREPAESKSPQRTAV